MVGAIQRCPEREQCPVLRGQVRQGAGSNLAAAVYSFFLQRGLCPEQKQKLISNRHPPVPNTYLGPLTSNTPRFSHHTPLPSSHLSSFMYSCLTGFSRTLYFTRSLVPSLYSFRPLFPRVRFKVFIAMDCFESFYNLLCTIIDQHLYFE